MNSFRLKMEEKKFEKGLEEKLKQETDKPEWLYVPELEIEVQTEVHHKGKLYAECKRDLSEGELIPTYWQIQWLRNSKYKDQLNLVDTAEFVQNPDNSSKENKIIAWFYANEGHACIDCFDFPGLLDSYIGVRFVRKKLNVNQTNRD